MINSTSTEIDPILAFVENSWVQLVTTLGVLAIVFYELGLAVYNKVHQKQIQQKERYDSHCENLFAEFDTYLKTNSVLGASYGWKYLFDRFHYKQEFISHLYTGHFEIYQTLLPILQSNQRDAKMENIFKISFIEFIKEIRIEIKPLNGICDRCKDLKNDKNLKKNLDSFTMPF